MVPFFVTGYPRSRTAWLSVALTTAERYCWHEALCGARSFAEVCRRVEQGGTADCGLPFLAKALAEKYPAAPWVLIERDPDAVSRSLTAIGLHPDLSALTPRLNWIREHLHPLVVPYARIDQRIGDIAAHCLGHIPPHLAQLTQLCIVDRDPIEKVRGQLEAIKSLMEDQAWDG